jgi:phosphoribosyl-ATP pyrophosphohydrolase
VADLLYHLLVAMAYHRVDLAAVYAELHQRRQPRTQ